MVQAKGQDGTTSLKKAFPCRDAVIDGLERLVRFSPEGSAPVLLSGAPSTGKTAITRCAQARLSFPVWTGVCCLLHHGRCPGAARGLAFVRTP